MDRDELNDELQALEANLDDAGVLVAAFNKELQAVQQSAAESRRELAGLRSGIGGGLRRAIDGVVLDGEKLSEALNTVVRSVIDSAYSAALRPVTDAAGGFLASGVQALMNGVLPFANGGVLAGGRVTPFSGGGVVGGPTTFAMRGGLGLMGEAGPEAILPLARGPDGKLGVRGGGAAGRPVQVTINVSTPDAQSFQRSGAQIAAQMQRLLQRGQRNG